MPVVSVFLGPDDAVGYLSKLRAGLESIGIEAEHGVFAANPYGYEGTPYFLAGAYLRIAPLLESGNLAVRGLGRVARLLLLSLAFLRALLRHDTFVFLGFTSFFRFRELPLLKWLGKRVIVVYVGSDCRPPYLSGRYLDDRGATPAPEVLHAEALEMRARIARVERHADVIVNHTATSQFFHRPFVRFLALGMPFDAVPASAAPAEPVRQRAFRILHAPSRPRAKGTAVFRDLIARLRAAGHDIDFVELVGRPNAEVLAELERCDLVVDELYSDTPMAMLATEAAAHCRASCVGSYYAPDCARDNPDHGLPPSCFVKPEQFGDALEDLLQHPERIVELGAAAGAWVSSSWSSKVVAERFANIIDGAIPDHWYADPEKLEYIEGWGLAAGEWRALVGAYCDRLGPGALLLDDKPALRERILQRLEDGDGPGVDE